jgi:hypothetical protein
MAADKRESERIPILGDLRGEIMVFQPMLVREISRGGANIETRTPLQLNSLHDLRLTLGDTSVVVKGRVVHSRISDVEQDVVTYRSGIQFVATPERVIDAIDAYVQTLKTDRSRV